jgi:hypothetical protein
MRIRIWFQVPKIMRTRIRIRNPVQDCVTGYRTVQCYQRCGSGMLIPNPDFFPSRILDPESKNNKKEGGGEPNQFSSFFLETLMFKKLLSSQKIWVVTQQRNFSSSSTGKLVIFCKDQLISFANLKLFHPNL